MWLKPPICLEDVEEVLADGYEITATDEDCLIGRNQLLNHVHEPGTEERIAGF
ncbi:MAG: hypothetical protein ACKOSQ_11255 [Planctomycetaceae bacterium]